MSQATALKVAVEPVAGSHSRVGTTDVTSRRAALRSSLRFAGAPGPAIHPNRGTLSDEEALSHLSDGDSTGFWILWESYRSYLYGVCLKQMGGVREDAEDALSRAMLKAWDRLPRYASEIANVKAWLTRLVCNLCLDIHRERKIRVRNAVNLDDAIAADSKSLALDMASPEAEVLSSEIYDEIRNAVDNLPVRLREPFKLRFFDEMSYTDIAEKLELSGDNVRKRIQLARAQMQEMLSKYLPSGPQPA